MNLKEFTNNQMKEAKTISITGIILKSEIDGMITIVPCLCVQDTRENPCPCGDFKILISKTDLVGDIECPDQKSIKGEKLSSLTVNRDANILVEQTTSVKAENALGLTHTTYFPPSFPVANFPMPPFSPPPPPDPSDPGVVYFWPAIVGAGALLGGAIIGGYYAIRRSNCTTTTTVTESTDSNGNKITTTVVDKKCG